MSREARGSSAYTTLDVAALCDLVQHVVEVLCTVCPSRENCTVYNAWKETEIYAEKVSG